MIVCSKCSERTHVYDSRPWNGQILRRRECLFCRHRFNTLEAIRHIEFSERLDALVSEVSSLAKAVKEGSLVS